MMLKGAKKVLPAGMEKHLVRGSKHFLFALSKRKLKQIDKINLG